MTLTLARVSAIAIPTLLLLLSLPACGAARDVITLTTGEWRPYLSRQFAGNGAIARIVTAAFALEGVEVRYLFRPWKRAYEEAAEGGAEGSLAWSTSQRWDNERQRLFYFSDAVFDGQSVFFHLKSMPFRWRDDPQLTGVTMGGTLGYEYFFDEYPGLKIDRSAPSDELNFYKLLAGRFQIFPANLDVGLYFLHRELPPEQAALLTWDPAPYNTTTYYLMLNRKNKANPDYLARFNRGLQKLKASGKYQQTIADLKGGRY
jgi:polar amino acid transport system substrate-binding protein